MTDQEFSQIIVAEIDARAEHEADPTNNEKFDRWFASVRAHRQALQTRQIISFTAKYPVTQFEREPDEHLID